MDGKKPTGKGLAGLGKAMATKMAERKPAAEAVQQKGKAEKDARRAKVEAKASAQKAYADYKAQRDSTKAAASKPAAPNPFKDKATRAKAVSNFKAAAPKPAAPGMKSGGSCKKYARGGGIEVRGKTKGKII
jgi:hypothetical protein